MTALIDPPSDCPQPADHGPSWYLMRRCRTYAEVVRDISRHRDMDDYVWEELHRRRHTAEVISLAHARAERRRDHGR
jgi:hypothetical protein